MRDRANLRRAKGGGPRDNETTMSGYETAQLLEQTDLDN